jgi:hypothetical protein
MSRHIGKKRLRRRMLFYDKGSAHPDILDYAFEHRGIG